MDFDCSHAQDIKKDQLILLRYRENGVSRTAEVRLVCYSDPESGEILEFITNLKGLDAVKVTLLYKIRWVIEMLLCR